MSPGLKSKLEAVFKISGLKDNLEVVFICILIALSTVILYVPALQSNFVDFNDDACVTQNPHVQTGLTFSGVWWSLKTGQAGSWQPVTWISHMVDCQIYSLNPAGHHLTNVLLHVANSILVFLLLLRITRSRGHSVLVAVLFAWHPTNVESVAWVSERREVLSTLFWLLTMTAYVRYVHGPKQKQYYRLALLFFSLGLMSNPTLVTLPFVLLLMDFWPLKRGAENQEQPSLLSLPWRQLAREKAPFFVLAFVACIVTLVVQRFGGAMLPEDLPLSARIANAPLTCWRYVLKMFCPVNLSVFYPQAPHASTTLVAVATVALVATALIAILFSQKRPYAATGWFWFLGTLVPTLGIVLVGWQSMADRYLYIPSIGLFILVVWGLNDLLASRLPPKIQKFVAEPVKLKVAAAVTALLLLSFFVGTWRQAGQWSDTERLFNHAIDVTENNFFAHNGLGNALARADQTDEALKHYLKAVEINPAYPESQYNVGSVLLTQSNLDEAIVHLSAALEHYPNYGAAHNNLGKALSSQGKRKDAIAQLTAAVKLMPDSADAHYNLAAVDLAEGHLDDAITNFSDAIRLIPDYGEAHRDLGIACLQKGDAARAVAELTEASRLIINDPDIHADLGYAFMKQDKLAEATTELEAALLFRPDDFKAHLSLAQIKVRQHNTKDAIPHYKEMLRLRPDVPELLNSVAWILATDPGVGVRNGLEAIQLAQRACDLTRPMQATFVLTLAAAQAEAGRYTEAIASAQKAKELALSSGHQADVAKSDKLLARFWARQAYREVQ
jgi:tetratricopeptide (TPR) repeat protein